MSDEHLTMPEAAKYLKVSLSTLRGWRINKLHLPDDAWLKPAGKVYLRKAALDDFMNK